jgi:hypothetical protein
VRFSISFAQAIAAFVCPWVGGKKILKVSLVGFAPALSALVAVKVIARTTPQKNIEILLIITVSSFLSGKLDGKSKINNEISYKLLKSDIIK